MLHVTIKDTTTNEVIYDRQDVSAIAIQAADRDKITAIRHRAEGADPKDTFSCMKALLKEAEEVKHLISETLESIIDKAISDAGDDNAK